MEIPRCISVILGVTLAATVLLTHPGRAAAHGTGPCPTDGAATRRLVVHFLLSPDYSLERQTLSLPGDTIGLRALAAPADSLACTALTSAVRIELETAPLMAYFRIGNRYILSSRRSRALSGFTPLVVLDSNYVVLRAIAM